MDAGVYRICVDILSGADHLEGRWVVAVGDGMVVRPCKVVGGQVLLDGITAKMPTKAGRWHVGLSYRSRMQTLEMEPGQSTAMANNKAVVGVTIYVKDTRGLWVGPDFEHLRELPSRYQEQYQEAPRLHYAAGRRRVRRQLEQGRAGLHRAARSGADDGAGGDPRP